MNSTMRSSNSKPSKSVSICNESYPNGPCTKKEGGEAEAGADHRCTGVEANEAGEDDIAEDRVHTVASKVIEDVVRLASKTANDKKAEALDASTSLSSQAAPESLIGTNPDPLTRSENEAASKLNKAEKLQRLPTIQIDTVPSLPSSPTEWQAPSKDHAIAEEEEEDILDDEQIDICFSSTPEVSKESEVQEFAAIYIKDIIEKAMALVEEKQRTKDAENAREIASKVVEDVISQANDKAFEKLRADLEFPENVPSIQIDTVPSIPPSPDLDEEEQRQNNARQNSEAMRKRKKVRQIVYHDDDDDDVAVKPQPLIKTLIKHSEAPKEIKEFASSYVKDIISKAITMAEEKLVSSVPFNFEDVDLMKTSGPWYIRAREAFMRILRSACFCTPRREDS